ncbi:hypothetical protein GCM10009784_25800 [Arthrobacter parietis]|uniref:Uncharacterized protein n=1 Tax=Arthrobacter parietis TaxID=271434 RepID=A0ABN3B0R1_9MICC
MLRQNFYPNGAGSGNASDGGAYEVKSVTLWAAAIVIPTLPGELLPRELLPGELLERFAGALHLAG